MRKTIIYISLLMIFLFCISFNAAAVSPEEIIQKMEQNEVHDTAKVEGSMYIENRFGTKTTHFISWARGEDESLIEFLDGDEDGQKILKTPDTLYLYFPDADEIIRLQGAALRNSVMGSDFSYEDMTGGKGLLDDYSAELLGKEEIDGHSCWKIELTAKGRNVPYPKEIVWIDEDEYVTRKAEMYSRSDKLLKVMDVKDYITQEGKKFPGKMIMRDVLKKSSSTTFSIDDIELGVDIPNDFFSLQELTW
ncbi:MAG: outer membrane lipoprotein-sorting protein [Spirochaetia bacterium]|nr:outer membrane lipoprotein-sorting protein [Spirochaetia bacterium]MCF7952941.1 outer membrane lipoprotein-sorting protein [Spirochaetales bacterium]